MLPIQRKISPYNHYDYNTIKFLVIHYVGANSTAKNNVDYFYGGNRQASAHYFVDDISIWQSVEDSNGSWHVGNTRTEVKNTNSIGIEMCLVNGVVTEKTEKNTLELAVYLMKKYNIPIGNLRTHYEVTGGNKICPNWNADNWSRWKTFKKKVSEALTITSEGDAIIPENPPTSTVKYPINKYKNGSTSEIVYQETSCKTKIGSLDAKEICDVLYVINNVACVLYKVTGTSTKKVGFVKWLGGVQGNNKYAPKDYINGSTQEIVYQESSCKSKIGSLNPKEKARCIYETNGRAVVLYKIDGTTHYKVGFCKWLGGIK